MLRIWSARDATVMFQDHDAITITYPEAHEDRIIPLIQTQLLQSIPLKNGRNMTIPYDCKTGWNKGDWDKDDPTKNPDGLKDYYGHDNRKRLPKLGLLDRKLR